MECGAKQKRKSRIEIKLDDYGIKKKLQCLCFIDSENKQIHFGHCSAG